MGYIHSPIGELLLLPREDRERLISPVLLAMAHEAEEKVMANLPIGENSTVSDLLLEEIFAIRLAMIEAAEQESILEKIENKLLKEAESGYLLTGKLEKLSNIRIEVIEVYAEILSNLRGKNNQPSRKIPKVGLSTNLTLRALWGLSQIQPSPDLEQYLVWLTSSLSFEFHLMAAEFGVTGKFNFTEHEADLLSVKLRLAFENFAAHTIITGLWEPAATDERQLVRNIKIVTANLRSERGDTVFASLEMLREMILQPSSAHAA